jgi:hypothetical protein
MGRVIYTIELDLMSHTYTPTIRMFKLGRELGAPFVMGRLTPALV